MESLRKQAARILREKKKYKLWLTAFLCMAVLVTAGTVAALTMNGQALNRKEKLLICGLDVHEHTEQCRDSEGELVCGQADYVIHIHNDDCYGKDGALVCALPERKPHVHDAACLEEQKTLTCTLEETHGHQHDEACYTKVRGELTCGQDGAGHRHGPECYTKVQGEPICGTDGTGHRHGPECYAKVQGELTCASAEEGHEHNEGCYAWSEELTCGLAEEIHEHTDECYAWSEELACGLAEEAHEHTDDCYAWSEELNCEIPEGEDAHAHTEDCHTIEENYICGELELHAHEDGCYDEEGNLICEEIELLEHVHADDCFEIIEPDASGEESEESNQESGASEESQEGNAAADESGAESSEAEEDSEGEPEDSEGEEELFRKTYEDAEIRVVAEYHKSANIPEEAQLVAERIGTEAEGDAPEAAEEDGDEAAGGQDTDDAQGADGTDGTQDSQGSDGTASEQAPVESEAGDGTGSDGAEDGIEPVVDEVADPTEPEGQSGDAEPTDDGEAAASEETVTEEVSYRLKFLVDGKEIEPEGTVTFTVWNPEEEDGEPQVIVYEAGDGLDAMVVTLKKTVVVEAEDIIRKVYEDDTVRVIAEYSKEAKIPDEAELIVKQITPESDPERYAVREETLRKQIGNENATMDILLSIGFYVSDGENGLKEIEPEETVTITLQFLGKDGAALDAPVDIVHFVEDGAELLEASDVDANGATTFQTDSFSDFAGSFGNEVHEEESLILTDWTVATYSGGEGIPCYVSDGEQWAEISDKFSYNNVAPIGNDGFLMPSYYIAPCFNNYGYSETEPTSESRWIGYSKDGGNTITTAIYNQSFSGWVLEGTFGQFEDARSITGIYYLPGNTTKYDGVEVSAALFAPKRYVVEFNPGNGNKVEASNQYGSVGHTSVNIESLVEGNMATLRLPGDNELGKEFDFSVDGGAEIKETVGREAGSYDFKLVGWFNIADNTYYDVKNGPVNATVDVSKKNVFYADWVAADYNLRDKDTQSGKGGNVIENVPSTNDFIKTRLFDYNELFNIYSAINSGENAKGGETWTDGEANKFHRGTWTSSSSGLGRILQLEANGAVNSFLFLEAPTGLEGASNTGVLVQPQGYADRNGKKQDDFIQGDKGWGISTSGSSPLDYLFSESSDALGVHFIGYGDNLYQHFRDNEDKIGYYEYDSSKFAASYQQREGRFYLYDKPQTCGSTAFLPFNDNSTEFKVNGGGVNYHFGMSSEIDFYLPADSGSNGNLVDGKAMTFEFSGDDDVWVFIDGNLILDMGGIHGAMRGSINFTTGKITTFPNATGSNISELPLIAKGEHKLTIYYLERGAGQSNCKIHFNIVPRYVIEKATASTVTATKVWDDGFSNHNPIQVGLYDGDELVADRSDHTITLSDENGWKYVWEGLPLESNYQVKEISSVPGYTSTISFKTTQSHMYWAETNTLMDDGKPENEIPEDERTIIILGQKDAKALNSGMGTTEVTVNQGVISSSSITSEIKWLVEKMEGGYALKNAATGKYLKVDQSGLSTSDVKVPFNLSSNERERLHCGNYRVLFDGGKFYGDVLNGNDSTNSGSVDICVRIFRYHEVASRVKNYTVKNTYLPTITIEKVDGSTDKVLQNAKFTLTREYKKEITVEGEDESQTQWETWYGYYGNDYTWHDSKEKPDITSGNHEQYVFAIESGSLRLENLPNGKYTLAEIAPPDDYELPADPAITFEVQDKEIVPNSITSGKISVTDDGKDQIDIAVIKPNTGNLFLQIRNKKVPVTTANVKFVKYGTVVKHDAAPEKNKPLTLKGASFEIYKTDKEGSYYIQNGEILSVESAGNGTVIDENSKLSLVDGNHVSNDNGVFYTNERLSGIYYIKESNAPDGYNRLTGLIQITVEDSGEVSAKVYTQAYKWEEKRDIAFAEGTKEAGFEVKVYNTAGFELPETGGTGTKPYTIGGAALATAAVFLMYGYSMRRKKRKGGMH